MAVETITLGELSKQVLMVIANAESTTADAAMTRQVRWAIHSALREFVSRVQPVDFRDDKDITVIAATKDYSLDDSFMQMIEPGVYFTAADYRTLEYKTEQAFRAERLEASPNSSDPWFYLLRKRDSTTGAQQLRLWPTPSANRTIRYHFVALSAKLYDGTDVTVIDPRLRPDFHQYLIDGAVYWLRRYLNVGGDWQPYHQAWERAIEAARKMQPAVVGQTYQVAPYGGQSGRYPTMGTITAL